jgi:hypothetical protein
MGRRNFCISEPRDTEIIIQLQLVRVSRRDIVVIRLMISWRHAIGLVNIYGRAPVVLLLLTHQTVKGNTDETDNEEGG